MARLEVGITQQKLGESENGVKGCADFMGHVGQKHALGPIGSL